MGKIPADRDARLDFLAGWAMEQQRQMDASGVAAPSPREPRRRGERALDAGAIWGKRIQWLVEERLDRVLDRRLHTSGHVADIPEIAGGDGQIYAPSPWYILPRALRAVGASDRDVLVDFGCGKGRIVHQAAQRPLKRVIGVEISPQLAAFAQTLVAVHRREYRCQSVEIVVCDASRFQVPDDLTIAYLFFPFGEKTLDAVLRHLVESIDRRPRRVRLIYALPLPVYSQQVLATGRFQKLREIRLSTLGRALTSPYGLSRAGAAIFESDG